MLGSERCHTKYVLAHSGARGALSENQSYDRCTFIELEVCNPIFSHRLIYGVSVAEHSVACPHLYGEALTYRLREV